MAKTLKGEGSKDEGTVRYTANGELVYLFVVYLQAVRYDAEMMLLNDTDHDTMQSLIKANTVAFVGSFKTRKWKHLGREVQRTYLVCSKLAFEDESGDILVLEAVRDSSF